MVNSVAKSFKNVNKNNDSEPLRNTINLQLFRICWTLLAYTQTFLKKKGSRLYAKHTKTSIKTIYQSLLSS